MRFFQKILKSFLLVLALLHMPNLSAQHFVEISGVVDSDLVIRKLGQDSAYLVVSSLVVINGATLTINPGVKAYFRQSSSLIVNTSNLIIEGTETDSISFYCEDLSRDWPGISVRDITPPNNVVFSYVNFYGASTAIYLSGSSGISVLHSTFYNAFGKNGVVLGDCDSCRVEHCIFKCLAGITLSPKGKDIVGNYFAHNVFVEGQTNITISNSMDKICYDNVIVDNCFMDAPTAIYFSNHADYHGVNKKNYIRNNVISSKVPLGNPGYISYGIKTSMDSLVIENNIFYNNDVSICLLDRRNTEVSRNTFYENRMAIQYLSDSISVLFRENTISESWNQTNEITSNENFYWHNNFLHYDDGDVLFSNITTSAIDMRENYWSVNDADAIENVILDDDDDPNVGPILYENYLHFCDTISPISPPFSVRKQAVGNDVLVSWESNPEADLSHYALFYGDFKYYKFSHHIDSIFTNSYLLVNHDIDEDIAVVACDTVCDFDIYAVASKSAYAFANLAVYAGEDALMCVKDQYFVVQNASAPFAGSELKWKTSGSGFFSDSSSLTTNYYPSEEDFDSGMVSLTLVAYTENEYYEDSLELQFHKEQVAFAGEDSYGGTERPLQLLDAFAEHFDSFSWRTLGDGAFDDTLAMHPNYYPGVSELQNRKIQLVLSVRSVCGESFDTVSFDLFDEYSMEGKVWADQELVQGAQVLAISIGEGNAYSNGFFRTQTQDDGTFRFERLFGGEYMLYAFPDTTALSAGGSYYLQRESWNKAIPINVNGDVYDVDVALPVITSNLVKGEGQICGRFDLPETDFRAENFYCQPWFGGDSVVQFCDGGLSNIGIALMNASKTVLLGFAITDAKGFFHFDSLLYGTYCLLSEVPRYGQMMEKMVTLSPDNQSINNIHLFIDQQGRISFKDENESIPIVGSISLFPNPTEEWLYVEGLSGNAQVRVVNSFGQVVLTINDLLIDPSGVFSVNVQNLQNGLFLLRVQIEDSEFVMKFLKR